MRNFTARLGGSAIPPSVKVLELHAFDATFGGFTRGLPGSFQGMFDLYPTLSKNLTDFALPHA